MEDIISLCKRRGFIYRGSDVYGGLAGTWDWGPLGVALKRNVMQAWWHFFVDRRPDIYGVDAAVIMNPKVWQASGHVATFADPMVEDMVNHRRWRADHLLEDHGIEAEGHLTVGEGLLKLQQRIHIGVQRPGQRAEQGNVRAGTVRLPLAHRRGGYPHPCGQLFLGHAFCLAQSGDPAAEGLRGAFHSKPAFPVLDFFAARSVPVLYQRHPCPHKRGVVKRRADFFNHPSGLPVQHPPQGRQNRQAHQV